MHDPLPEPSVHRLRVEQVAPRREKAPESANAAPAHDPFETPRVVIQAAAFALSARALLLIALLGAFALAWQAMSSQTTISIVVLAIYGAFTILPVAYLETRRGRTQ
jgi:hypothetical protein